MVTAGLRILILFLARNRVIKRESAVGVAQEEALKLKYKTSAKSACSSSIWRNGSRLQ
jgi:hypothetical protein